MVRVLVATIVLGALATGAHADAEGARAAALPELARVEGPGATVLVLRGELGRKRAPALVALARAVYADLGRRFLRADPDAEPRPVDVCLFATTAAYRAIAAEAVGGELPSELGFYLPGERLVLVNLERGLGNLPHEIAHPILEDDFPGLPAWMNEGIASLYGGSVATRAGVRFRVNYRHRHLRAAAAAGTLPGLDELAASSWADVHGEEAMTWYALARTVLLYLESRSELEAFYAEIRDGADPGDRLRARVDARAFSRWSAALAVGRLVRPAR